MCKSESIKVYEVTKETAEKLKVDEEELMYIETEYGEKSVEIRSNFSVRHDNLKPEEYRLKCHIKEKLDKLRAVKGEILIATYGGERPKGSDIENLLFYNIGTGAFSKVFQSSKKKQVAFKMDSTSQENQSSHKYKYEVVSSKVVEALGRKALIAKWNGITIGRTLPQKPDEYYAALRSVTIRKANDSRDEPHENEVIRHGSERCETSFGIKIELIVPDSKKSIHPVSVMKHLLDGVICAFHGEDEDGNTWKSLEKRFEKDAYEKLWANKSDSWNLLGKQKYLSSKGWNPADEADRLQFGWIVVEQGKDNKYKMSGKIYKWV